MDTRALTFAGFCDWAREQPDDKTFRYWSIRNCAGGQYAQSLGLRDIGDLPRSLEHQINSVASAALGWRLFGRRRTFGDLRQHLPA